MKHISKRGLIIAAAVAVTGTVLTGPAAIAGSSDNRAKGRATSGADSIKIDKIKGDRDEASGSFRIRSGGNTAYGTPLCVTGTHDGPGNTVAFAVWINRSNFPAISPLAQGKFGVQYVQDRSGPDAGVFIPVAAGPVRCPSQGFLLTSIPAPGLQAVSGDYDTKVKH